MSLCKPTSLPAILTTNAIDTCCSGSSYNNTIQYNNDTKCVINILRNS